VVERLDGLLALLHGARIVRHSPYLLMIAGILLLSEMSSVLLDFQFTTAVIRDVPAEHFKAYFGAVYTFSNLISLVVQLTLTGWLMRRFGPQYALYVMPLAVLVATGAYMALPVLLFASLLNTADSGFAYSVQQTAKESLYVPTADVEKYDAKAFIDIVWLRVAKGIAVLLGLVLSALQGSDTRLLSVAVLVVLACWLVLARKMSSGYTSLSSMRHELPVGGKHAA
jgi:AAA family ATP:ADP antiporter